MLYLLLLFWTAFVIMVLSLYLAVAVAGGPQVRWRNSLGMAVGMCFVLIVLEIFFILFAAKLMLPPLLLAVLSYPLLVPVFVLAYGLTWPRALGVLVIMGILRQALIVTFCLVVRGPTEVGFCQQLFF